MWSSFIKGSANKSLPFLGFRLLSLLMLANEISIAINLIKNYKISNLLNELLIATEDFWKLQLLWLKFLLYAGLLHHGQNNI